MKNKTRPEKSVNSLQDKVWNVLEKAAERHVRKEKTGYLQLLKIYERDESIIDPVLQDAQKFLKEEADKGYDEEDIQFYTQKRTKSAWYNSIGLAYANKNTKRGNTTVPFSLSFSMTQQRKETFEAVKNLEKKFQEEEQKAREYLHDELQELDALRDIIGNSSTS